MKLLVTGGAGFIGSNFIHYWLKTHPADEIVNLDKLTYAGNLYNLIDLKKNKKHYKFINGDICDLKLVRSILKNYKVDKIIHFAAQSHVDQSILYKEKREERLKKYKKNSSITQLFKISIDEDFVLNNVWGTHILLEAAVKEWIKKDGTYNKNKRFHHVSTDEVFGALKLTDKKKFDENTVYNPRSPYAASKAGADHLVRAYFTTYGLPITITNTSNNYGNYQYPEKLLPLAITNLIQGKKVPIYGDGKYVRDWLFVEDHCRAIDLALQKGKIGETYCIGGLTDDVNNLEIIKRVLKIMSKDEGMLEYVKDRPGHDRRYAVDWSKAKNELGYQPKFDLDAYLEKTVKWYQENEWWWRKIVDKKEHEKYIKKQYGK